MESITIRRCTPQDNQLKGSSRMEIRVVDTDEVYTIFLPRCENVKLKTSNPLQEKVPRYPPTMTVNHPVPLLASRAPLRPEKRKNFALFRPPTTRGVWLALLYTLIKTVQHSGG